MPVSADVLIASTFWLGMHDALQRCVGLFTIAVSVMHGGHPNKRSTCPCPDGNHRACPNRDSL